jgi:hypothetical protein
MATTDPGLDRHEWETELASLEEQLEESPAEALPDLAALVERMLLERGFAIDDPVARQGDDPEIVDTYLAAREIANLAERGEADPGDIGAAIENLRATFDALIAERSPP